MIDIKGLSMLAYVFTFDELRTNNKVHSADDDFEALKEKVVKRIVDRICFELSSDGFAWVNDSIKEAINDYYRKESKND